MQKRQRQDGYLNDADKEQLKTYKEKSLLGQDLMKMIQQWTKDNDILYSLLCIAFLLMKK